MSGSSISMTIDSVDSEVAGSAGLAETGSAVAGAVGPAVPQIQENIWDDPAVSVALASRDIAGVYRFLASCGYSQRRMAELTGQCQSEVNEIIAGRTVKSYDVLERIAQRLGIPRGRLGLAYDEQTSALLESLAPNVPATDEHSGSYVTLVRLSVKRPRRLSTTDFCNDSDVSRVVDAVLATHPVASGAAFSPTVAVWTGIHVRALRDSMRLTVGEFAGYLGFSSRSVNKWEAGGAGLQPGRFSQAALDTCLARADSDQRRRFAVFLELAMADAASIEGEGKTS